MNSNEALALACVKYWCRVVVHKNGSCGELDENGRPWTRLTPDECAEWIDKFFECQLTPRQCANALRSLERSGQVIRQQRALHKWVRTFSYSVADWSEGSLDLPISAPSKAPKPALSIEPEPASLTSSSSISSTKKSSTSSEEPEAVVDGTPDGPKPPAPTTQVARNYRSTGLKSEVPQGSKTLAEVAALCNEKGGLPALPIRRDRDGFLIRPDITTKS